MMRRFELKQLSPVLMMLKSVVLAMLLLQLVLPTRVAGDSIRESESEIVIGTSVNGRPIIARRFGNAFGAPVLAVGSVHGNERSGLQIVMALGKGEVPDGFALWLIDDINPDGAVLKTRQNARGVDLNRNFPMNWQRLKCPSKFCSGRRAASEPETLALINFLDSVKPVMTVFYHSVGNLVDLPIEGVENKKVLRDYAKRSGLPIMTMSCGVSGCTGNATKYANTSIGAGIAFVVELPCHNQCLSKTMVKRHVRAFWSAAKFTE